MKVTYLGYKIDSQGIHLIPDKIEAIKNSPSPRNVTQLKSYLGLLSYYSRFLPNLRYFIPFIQALEMRYKMEMDGK